VLPMYLLHNSDSNIYYLRSQIAAEKSNRQFETEVSQLNVKLTELTRELRDATAQRNYGQQELSMVTTRVSDLENQLAQANKAKLALSKRIDELQKIDDDETSTRSRVSRSWNRLVSPFCLNTLCHLFM
jgi:chromosome segregation ATPase